MTTTFESVAALIRETLALGEAEVRPEQLLFYDLAFTSLDLLDLLFRIEETMGLSVTEGMIYRLARGDVPDEQFADKGYLTPLGRERLMALLSDTPPAVFPERIDAQTLPRYCTVGALVRLLDHLRDPLRDPLREQRGSGAGGPDGPGAPAGGAERG